MKNIKNNDGMIGLFILLIGIYLLIESIKLFKIGNYYDSPGLLPAIISSIMILSSVSLIWKGIEVKKTETSQSFSSDSANSKSVSFFNFRIIVIIIIITLYIITLDRLGFLFSSIIFLFILMYYLKSESLLTIIILSTTVPILIQYIFKNIFHQIIP